LSEASSSRRTRSTFQNIYVERVLQHAAASSTPGLASSVVCPRVLAALGHCMWLDRNSASSATRSSAVCSVLAWCSWSSHINVTPTFLVMGRGSFSFAGLAQIEASLPRVALGELTMPETEKTKSEKPETRPTDDGYLTPTPPKTKIVQPVVSQASHYS
jgi:hypothetical protein